MGQDDRFRHHFVGLSPTHSNGFVVEVESVADLLVAHPRAESLDFSGFEWRVARENVLELDCREASTECGHQLRRDQG